jgi:raffinose/stachyose/melibiose transport system permease protein
VKSLRASSAIVARLPWRSFRATSSRRPVTRYGSRVGILAFLLPGFIAYVVLLFLPSLASILVALFEWSGFARGIRFVGLDNFVRLTQDPVVGIAIANGLRNIALAVFLQVPIGLVLGYVLSRRVRGGRAFLFFFFLPVIVSEATLALMWRSIYQGDIGPLNGLLQAIGLEQLIRPWLSTDGIVQWTVLIPGTWAWVGFNIVLFLTAINGISRDLLDAATVDGATPLEEFRFVVAPSIRRVYVAATTLAIAGAVSPFLYPLILTQGGPLDMTQSLMTYAWQQIFPPGNARPEWGYGAAIAVLHFGFAIVLTGIVWRFGRRGLEVGE